MLDDFILSLKEETKTFNELEIIRYVYIKLGLMMSFDLNFWFGSEQKKEKIFHDCFDTKKYIIKYLSTQTVICSSLAFTVTYILNALLKESGIQVESVYENEAAKYTHVYNLVFLPDGSRFPLDLTYDLPYIKAHERTQYFGISQDKLEIIDYKIGYIKEKAYANSYDDLIKLVIDYFPLEEKVLFLLNNLSPYNSYKDMQYAEFKYYINEKIKSFITKEESRKLHIVDLYRINNEDVREYILCLIVDINNQNRKIYLYSLEKKEFVEVSPNEFLDQRESGLHARKKVPRIRRLK